MPWFLRLATACLVPLLLACNTTVESKAPAATGGGVGGNEIFGGTEPIANAIRSVIESSIRPGLARAAGGAQLDLMKTAIPNGYPYVAKTPFLTPGDACLAEARLVGSELTLVDNLDALKSIFDQPIAIEFQKGLRDLQNRPVAALSGSQRITLDPTLLSGEVVNNPILLAQLVLHEGIHMVAKAYNDARLDDGALPENLQVGGVCGKAPNVPTTAFSSEDLESSLKLVESMSHLFTAWLLAAGLFDLASAGLSAATLTLTPSLVNLQTLTPVPVGTAPAIRYITVNFLVRNLGRLAAQDLLITLNAPPPSRRLASVGGAPSKGESGFESNAPPTSRVSAVAVMSFPAGACPNGLSSDETCEVPVKIDRAGLTGFVSSSGPTPAGAEITVTYKSVGASEERKTSGQIIFSVVAP